MFASYASEQNGFVVSYCDNVANELEYNDTNCERNHTLTNKIMEQHNAQIYTKTVVKYFDLEKFGRKALQKQGLRKSFSYTSL